MIFVLVLGWSMVYVLIFYLFSVFFVVVIGRGGVLRDKGRVIG